MARKDPKPLTVLHVEDDENDAILLGRACERAGVPVLLRHVADGEMAKLYLSGEGAYGDRFEHPFPQIIILDLKMPRMDGFEFLKWVRGHERFARLPILVFTASMSREDKARALAEGADSYFVKPSTFDALVKMVGFLKLPDPGHRN